jgi:hypothetical protein
LSRRGEGFSDGLDADLSAVAVDEANLAGRDAIVYASRVSVLIEAAAELVDGSPLISV